MTTKSSLVFAALLAAACGGGVSAQDQPTGVKVADTVDVVATVETIDLAQRLVTVRGPWKDRSVTVPVGSEVPDLDKLKVGDRIEVTHNAAVVAEIKKPGTAERAARRGPSAESGDRTVVAVVESVVPAENRVNFTRDGQTRTAVVEDPDAQAFIKTLKKGDEVELVYTEAFATKLKRVP